MGAGRLIGAATVIALIAAWPIIQAVKADWEAERAAKSSETRRKIQEYAKTREALGMPHPFPPSDLLIKQDADARRLGGGGKVFEGAISAFGPTHMDVAFTQSGPDRCRETVRSLSRHKEMRIVVNGRTAHRKDAWRLCGEGRNHIRATLG